MTTKTRTKKRKRTRPLPTVVDELGELKAEIAELQEREDKLKSLLKKAGIEDVDGKLFHAHVATFEVERVDYKGLIQALNPPAKLLNRLTPKFTTEQEQTRITVTARQT